MRIAMGEMTAFLNRFKEFSGKLQETRIDEFKSRFGQIKCGMDALQNLSRQFERQTASQFNLFVMLGVESKEVKTHSAFLAGLLDSNGKHGQGSLFLEEFLNMLNRYNKLHNLSAEDDLEGHNGRWFIEKEKVTVKGNLDLVLTELGSRHFIVIENKIYAGDQDDQLKRYDEWLQMQSYPKSLRLVYLTLDGKLSKTISIDKKYYRISYRAHIVEWLEHSLRRIEPFRIRDIISQYLNLIKILTGGVYDL